MKIPKRLLRDCLLVGDVSAQDGNIEMACGYTCPQCGFFKPVAEKRSKRIERGELSYRTGSKGQTVAYLALKDFE